MRRVGICGAAETLLLDSALSEADIGYNNPPVNRWR